MKNLYFVFAIIVGLFITSCSMQDEVVNPINSQEEIATPAVDTLAVEEVAIEFDSFAIDYNVCLFSRDSVAVMIQSLDSTGNYVILSKDGTITPVSITDTILCKRGDQIMFDINFDGKPEQTEVVDFSWFTVDPTFYPSQYGDSAYTHIQVYTFISYGVSSTYTGHFQWGDYYIIRNGVRYDLGTFAINGNWCNGTCNPYIKIWTKDGDIVVLDYNRDGIPEYKYTVVDPNHV